MRMTSEPSGKRDVSSGVAALLQSAELFNEKKRRFTEAPLHF
jgi:hypothetical protein